VRCTSSFVGSFCVNNPEGSEVIEFPLVERQIFGVFPKGLVAKASRAGFTDFTLGAGLSTQRFEHSDLVKT